MEVGVDGTASVHAIVETLLTEGLASKKPKVIQASASLVLDATHHFGATSLPLATVTNAAPKMLAHSNATVRDCCIKVLAEICRALGGSKAPIQNVVDGMKKAQLSDLDALLTEQPEATPIRTGLRSQRRPQQQGGSAKSSTSPEDAIAALQANAKELEAQRCAARSAVDLIAAIGKTDYADQIMQSKWSEKVAALDKVLECGGEKPYKLMPPSPNVNYGPLIAEMKKLLAHTHFVVCSRAIQVLSMLAQGVGEKLYPHLRPTLTPLLQLSKDKKLTTEVSNGLDALFGTVLGFESLLENDDAIPSMVNEKVQKNALARATALNYVLRCVDRQISAGPKGALTGSAAMTIATLMCQKLEDSDASVRKVALSVLESLLRSTNDNDKSVIPNVQKVIEQLRTSNPRAHKTLTAKSTTIETKECPASNGSSSGQKSVSVEMTAVPPQPTRSRSAAPTKRPPSPAPTKTANQSIPSPDAAAFANASSTSEDRSSMPRLEEAMIHVTSLGIPLWDASEDDGGILAGLKGNLRNCHGVHVSMSL
jgi:cytoskeleton-associated protein 5